MAPVSSDADPERLLSQALRAQAASVPLREGSGAPPAPGHGPGVPGNGVNQVPGADQVQRTGRAQPADQGRWRAAAAGWQLVIALVLGLLAGAVAGLVSVL
jgi:hypothetical protein